MRFKKKKTKNQRGKRSHGWGAKKKHRGAGNRGGRGMAGTGKRADQRKPTIINIFGTDYFGKHGFKRPCVKRVKSCNIVWLGKNIDKLLKDGVATKEKDIINIDLKKIGVNKLLGKGHISQKLQVNVESASKGAVKKIEKAGGKVILAKPAKESEVDVSS